MAKDRKEQMKLWNFNNKESNKEKRKLWKKTDKGKKSIKITNWKQRGLVSDNYDEIYYRWLNSKKCELCKCEYSKKNKKCLDHSHLTGLFRNILCNSCNVSSKLKEISKNNTSGHKNIRITKNNTYRVEINVNKIYYAKTFETIEEAIEFRDFLV